MTDAVGGLSGRVCVITGAAGGVGRATARRLAQEGATVAYLATDDAGYITASAFPLDGGITAADTIPSAAD